ncbi:MAG: radical SAM protein, partial [Desulfobacterales bacterium]|nr:radical SAM protein [Desulfobacterales bacterium]
MKLHLVSLGCARNLVDSEQMLGKLTDAGWSITPDPGEADAIVVNTCSFIQPAADESIDVILEMAEFKRSGACRKLIVAGCLPERYGRDIAATLPEVDFFLGTGAFDNIVDAVQAPAPPPEAPGEDQDRCLLPHPETARVGKRGGARRSKRVLSVSHAAYLKIAEGCDRRCTYCIIPRLRGGHASRPLEEIASEADRLIRSGVKELSLVAQDSTAYGKDLSPPHTLARLLRRLSDPSDDIWIRVLYGHPDSIDDQT